MNLGIETIDILCTCENRNDHKQYKVYLEINKKRIYDAEYLGLSDLSSDKPEIIENFQKIRKKLDNYLLVTKKLLNFPTDLQNIILSYHLADFSDDWEIDSILLVLNDFYKFPKDLNNIIYEYSKNIIKYFIHVEPYLSNLPGICSISR